MKRFIAGILFVLVQLLISVPVLAQWSVGFSPSDRNSLEAIYQQAYEIEHHLHGKEVWLGRKAVPTATSFADTTLYTFTITAGADSLMGTPVQILGSDDTPWQNNRRFFDLHEVFIQTASVNTPFRLRFVYSATTYAAGRAAGQTFGTIFAQDDTNPQSAVGTPITVMCPRIPSGYNVWAECKNASDGESFTMKIGLHEYLR